MSCWEGRGGCELIELMQLELQKAAGVITVQIATALARAALDPKLELGICIAPSCSKDARMSIYWDSDVTLHSHLLERVRVVPWSCMLARLSCGMNNPSRGRIDRGVRHLFVGLSHLKLLII